MITDMPPTITDASQLADDAFLSQVFDHPCMRVVDGWDAQTLSFALAAIKGPAFVWAAGGPDNQETLRRLGFEDAIGGVIYERAAGTQPCDDASVDILVINASDAGQYKNLARPIGDLAARALTTSRFHQDPHIPNSVAVDIKRQWAMNFFTGARGDKMVVAQAENGNVVGFNQILLTPHHQVIDLICVDRAYHRSGIARALVAAMDTEAGIIRVGSQIGNDAADRFYKSLGFVAVGSTAYLHWHGEKI